MPPAASPRPRPTASKRRSPVPAPDPHQLHPSTRPELTNAVFLRNQITSEFIEVGEYTYHDDEGTGVPFETANVLYNYGPQHLKIGRFTAIAPGVTILMPAGNHPTLGPSTYPFTMFGGEWTDNTLDHVPVHPTPTRHGDRQRCVDRPRRHDHARHHDRRRIGHRRTQRRHQRRRPLRDRRR